MDACEVGGDGSPGYTWSTDNPYVAPFTTAWLGQPVHHRRIDYVLVGSPLRRRPSIVIRSCAVVLAEQGHDAPSDHYGVVADLALGGVVLGRGAGLAAWGETAAQLWP
jgi:hypothetical protein